MSPDYVLVPRAQQDELVAAFQKAHSSFWPSPEGAVDPKSDLGRIVNATHYARLWNLIKSTKGTIVAGGRTRDLKIELTIVKDVKVDDILMEEYVLLSYNELIIDTFLLVKFSGPSFPLSLSTISTMLFVSFVQSK